MNAAEKSSSIESVDDSFGNMDLYRLLEDSQGLISFSLYDSGTTRQGTSRYGFMLRSDEKIEIWPLTNSSLKITLDRHIPLNPSTVIFAGLYIGDGAKASHPGSAAAVSFSQRESHIANFVRNEFIHLFGSSLTFTHRVNEDALFFMTDEMRETLTKLREDLIKEGRTDLISGNALIEYLKRDLNSVIKEQPSTTKSALTKYSKKKGLQKHQKHLVEFFANREVMNEYLKRLKIKELDESGIPLSPNDRIAVNIRLPGVKGAREAGKSSRSDELDVDGLSHFHTLFLRILSDIQSSIEKNEGFVKVEKSTMPWLVWDGKPHEHSTFSLFTKGYLQESKTCGRFSRGTLVSYAVKEEDNWLQLSMGKFSVTVPKTLKFTPLVCLFFGLYGSNAKT